MAKPDPNGDQKGRPFSPPMSKMPSRDRTGRITHTPLAPPNLQEGVGTEEKSGGELGGPKRQRGTTPSMPVRR